MDDKKIAFISAVNDDIQYYQCLILINSLIVPDGFKIETIPIKNASCMCEAYNKGMNLTDAKYKVYLHQDAYILNLEFIQNMIDIFSKDDSIGLMGICGAKYLPPNGVWWESIDTVGKVYEKNGHFFGVLGFREIQEDYEVVDCVDGLIIMTQHDVKWRDDIFDGWHFYDISQSFEFRKSGYVSVVAKQTTPWCMHTRGYTDMQVYEKYRQIFLDNYSTLEDY